MDQITIWGPVRLLPTETTAWREQRAARVRELLSGREGVEIYQAYLQGQDLPERERGPLFQFMTETALVSGNPKSWEGGNLTLRVGEIWPVKLGHLALIDLQDGKITAIRKFPSGSSTKSSAPVPRGTE